MSGKRLVHRDVYVTSGSLLNEYCGNVGANKYPDDINIVSIKTTDIRNLSRVCIPMRFIGCRWMDDIVSNNRFRNKRLLRKA